MSKVRIVAVNNPSSAFGPGEEYDAADFFMWIEDGTVDASVVFNYRNRDWKAVRPRTVVPLDQLYDVVRLSLYQAHNRIDERSPKVKLIVLLCSGVQHYSQIANQLAMKTSAVYYHLHDLTERGIVASDGNGKWYLTELGQLVAYTYA